MREFDLGGSSIQPAQVECIVLILNKHQTDILEIDIDNSTIITAGN
jgi:hypothetical protein